LGEILKLEQTRAKLLSEIPEKIAFFFTDPPKFTKYGEVKQTKNLTEDQIKDFFTAFVEKLNKYSENLKDLTHEEWEGFIREYAEKNELKAGSIFMALRLAVTGSPFSPPLFEVLQILGKTESIKRIKK